MNSADDVERTVTAALDAAARPGSTNRVTAAQLRQWAAEYLRNWDDEVARFPDLASEPHYNFWMADGDPEREAMFVGQVFQHGGVDVIVGRGDAFDFRQFAEGDVPQDADRLFAVMRKRFPACRLQLPRAPAELWLGRSFPPAAE